ncbi:MAG: hypothetical protein IJC16_09435 [Rikenellaceae bacterium]|nr:hypothetical protein [Rikenellaceae bacterium]
MKEIIAGLSAAVLFAACGAGPQQVTAENEVLTDGIRFAESVLCDSGRLIVTSFGTDELNPLNTEGRGYVLSFEDSTSEVLIPADGMLSGPKGTLLRDGRLYVADVGKLVIYDLTADPLTARVIPMPAGEVFVNDLAADIRTRTLYVTVTNTGNIYALDMADPALPADSSALTLYANVPGANGILVHDGRMYVASYPADGVTTPRNVIYVLDDLGQPEPRQLISHAGQYDGLAIDGDRLYFTSWTSPKLGYVDLTQGTVTTIPEADSISGPARIAIEDGVLYIPDLPASRVIEHRLR